MKKVITDKLLAQETSLFQMIEGYAEKFKLSFEDVLALFEEETAKAVNRDIDKEAEIVLEANKDTQRIAIINRNVTVVDNEYDFDDLNEEKQTDVQRLMYITEEDARGILGQDVTEGDTVEVALNFDIFPEKTKTAIKNGFIQSLKLADKQRIFNLYSERIGEKIRAQVLSKNSKGSYNLKFEDGVTAFLPINKISNKLKLSPGQFIDVYLDSVNIESKLSICEVRVDSPKEVEEALKNEIPEIANGDIQIVKIQRIPGFKTKIAVQPNPEREVNYDIIGTLFGEGAKRILAISEKLNNEKVDIVRYSDDLFEYIKNALAPAKVVDVVLDGKKYIAIVKPLEIMSAIGKKGINIELAAKLVGARLEIVTTDQAVERNIDFKERFSYEKPLFKSTAKSHSAKSQSNKFFQGIDLDLSDFTDDLFKMMSQEEEIQDVQSLSKEKRARKETVKKSVAPSATELDSLFDQDNIQIDTDEEDYDFIEDIDSLFDESFVPEEEKEASSNSDAKNDKKTKNVIKAYQKSKVELKDFKVDNDLANYGLDTNIDLDEFDDAWED
ncbi:NusA N-terminal domain-containing protein [Mycoplasma buteonis]|uniref:NusA N-terminal domain-containing protein n=1 Tax=Mycoplasma buteonis TaxID=171280 RepID=UPI00055A2258|nr:NusA N-terminal domain-containing protein [Mycoplasma buteonis]